MDDTTGSFFDTNKLYIKSVQQETLARAKKSVSNDDPLYVEMPSKVVNK